MKHALVVVRAALGIGTVRVATQTSRLPRVTSIAAHWPPIFSLSDLSSGVRLPP